MTASAHLASPTTATSTAIARVLDRLPDHRKSSTGWAARCPAHEDHTASLTIGEGQNGRALLHCFAGCRVDAITQAMGLSLADLFPSVRVTHSRNGRSAVGSKPHIVECYDYTSAAGELLYQVVRYEPKDFRQRRPDGKGGWLWDMKGVTRVLYRLPDLANADPLAPCFVVEGERDADRLASLGLIATTNAGGAGKWVAAYSEALRGRHVVVLPDNDEPGRNHAEVVARSLNGVAATVRIVNLPDLPTKGDVSDWLDGGRTVDELQALVEAAPEYAPLLNEEPTPRPDSAGDNQPRPRRSQATQLIELAGAVELFHTPDGDPYACVHLGGHLETWPLRTQGFRSWLAHEFYRDCGGAPSAQALQDALGILEARARFDGPEERVFTRVGSAGDRIYLDLCNDAWQAVEISPTGWNVVDDPPVRFRRARGMLPLPAPQAGGSITVLRPFLNVGDEDSWMLIVSWLLSTFRPVGPFPVLGLTGEQGSAKTTTGRVLRALVDPATAPLRSLPKEERDLAISAANNWIVTIDNVSSLPAWLSDALCRLATGGGFSTRQLYSDADEVIFSHQRPM
ncbi:MAG: hypothetical protein ACR2PL_18785, partial [Dehalococcoidia bacterium]